MSLGLKKQRKGKQKMSDNQLTFIPPTPPPTIKPQWTAPATSMDSKITTMFPSHQEKLIAPVVYYTEHAWAVIKHLVASCSQEVGWLGTVQQIGHDYLIDQIYIPEQTVTGTETDIDNNAMVALAMEIMNEGKDPGTLFYWGHSHVNMGVSPSGQDEKQVAEYLDNCPIFIRGIYNKAGLSKVDVYDRESRLIYQCVKNTVQPAAANIELLKSVDAIITRNVKQRTYTTSTKNDYGFKNLDKYFPNNTRTKTSQDYGFGVVQNMIDQVTRFDETLGCYYFSDGSFLGELDIDAETLKLLDLALMKKGAPHATQKN